MLWFIWRPPGVREMKQKICHHSCCQRVLYFQGRFEVSCLLLCNPFLKGNPVVCCYVILSLKGILWLAVVFQLVCKSHISDWRQKDRFLNKEECGHDFVNSPTIWMFWSLTCLNIMQSVVSSIWSCYYYYCCCWGGGGGRRRRRRRRKDEDDNKRTNAIVTIQKSHNNLKSRRNIFGNILHGRAGLISIASVIMVFLWGSACGKEES